jgi:hypothetical protein
MFWLATAGVVRGELPQALEATNTFIGMADARRDRPALLNATRGRAMVLLFMGQIAKAREELERFIDTFDASAEADRQEAGRAGGQDPKAAGLALLSWALWLLGHEARALARIDEAVKRADALQHPHTRAYVYYYASILHALRKDAAQARNYAEQCFQLADRHGFRSWHSLSRAMSGITAQDPSTVELEEVQAALTDNRRAGYRFGLTVLYALLCPALLRAGRPEAALNVVDDGISTAENNSEAVFLSELYRQKAHALRFSAAVDAEKRAESLLLEALATSRQQSSRSLEFRTARNLAGLWVDQGDSNKAIDLLASMLSDSVETLDTQDLEATRKMLDTLARNDRGLL